MYVLGKSKYLEENGWGVQMFFFGPDKGTSQIPALTKYIESGGTGNFRFKPPYKFPVAIQEKYLTYLLQKFIQRFNLTDFSDCEIIVESHTDKYSFWAELFSSIVGARHFFFCMEEFYRGLLYRQFFEDNLDFFYFKWKRNELICRKEACTALFNGYKNVTAPLYEMPNTVVEAYPIQDVDFPIDKIEKLDWNICHIGRIKKAYVPAVIEGVAQLARRHPDKSINFIFVGDITKRKDFILQTLNNIDNVMITALGDMVPIPRILFSKIDVVCAIAQSATFSANEGTLTITGSNKYPDRTPGVLGYDTLERTFNPGTFSYVEALEKVLVERLYDNKEYQLPKLKPESEYYEKFWTIVEKAAPTKEYYVERLSRERIRDWAAIFPFGTIGRGARIIIFGATEIAKDYKRQIKSQANTQIEFGNGCVRQYYKAEPYCTVVATVDLHPEEFDNEVVGVERLLQKDYDVILMAVFNEQVQEAYNKIVQTVPDMVGKIIYMPQNVQI